MSLDCFVTYVLDRSSTPSSSDRYFGGREPAKFAARSTHFSSCTPGASPFGSTKTQAFIGRPVRSNTRVCGSDRARPASAGPRRTIRASRCTPQHMFPCSMKVIPPNIFLSASPVRLPRWARMRAASFSSKAIGPLPGGRGCQCVRPNENANQLQAYMARPPNRRSLSQPAMVPPARGLAPSGLSAAFAS